MSQRETETGERVSRTASDKGLRPSEAQRAYLTRGLSQPGGKLPLFDEEGQRYSDRTVRSCRERGWAEPWFENPIKPDWTVCRLTEAGRAVLEVGEATNRKLQSDFRPGGKAYLQLVQ